MGLEKIKQTYNEIYIILSPPRCSSTTLARVFWEHPTIGFYSHEPYEVVYHHQMSLEHAYHFIENPIPLKNNAGTNLIIKEMTFQVRDHFLDIPKITKHPLIFLMRDPRLNFWSRIKKFEEGANESGLSYENAGIDAGWHELFAQINQCKKLNIPYFIVDSTEFRNAPQIVLSKLFDKLNLSFSEKMLEWSPRPDINLCKPGGEHIKHFYERALESTGIQPAFEPLPGIDAFNPQVRPLLEKCNQIYLTLQQDENRLSH